MTIKVTPEYLAELRRLADAATPGPWDSDYRLGDIAIPVYVGEDEWEAYRLGAFECTNDAKFATASRTAIPELLDHIEKLEAANRWIPVTERLPERDCRVLIVVGYSHEKGFTSSDAGYLSSTGEWYYAEDDEHEIFHKDVTHWRELPAPPQEIK